MAYTQGTQSKFTSNKPVVAAKQATNTNGGREAILRTGLFKPTKEGVKAMASVKLKEAVTIPAGSYINLYHNSDKKSESSPDYTITVVEGKSE